MADALEIHPFMLSRWRKEARDGVLRGRVSVAKAVQTPAARDMKRFLEGARTTSQRAMCLNMPPEAQMSVAKTKPTEVSAESHIAAIENEQQRNDARRLVVLMRNVTRQEPGMWGPSIVGFGSYHYKYASGHEGDSALAGFAARGKDLVVYIAAGFEGRDALLAKLGEHRTGKVCVYIRSLANIDLKVLEKLVARSGAETKSRYPQAKANDA